ncbi:hypothetical protein RvY_16767-4 [Ramazzottius varieornatus]|uniref:Receptor ligand binding region domain-containing protein n=1 Tax=Ramazzottius varieornatus TaxID=947166 RepID=A0A1D1W3X9_RAMVA|nr:hypothetical protein RvY_16767-4 [Ramazzottius varieornatus]
MSVFRQGAFDIGFWLVNHIPTCSSTVSSTIEEKERWPTRVEAGRGGVAALLLFSRLMLSLMRYYNWNTVSIVVDGYRNPTMFKMALVVQQSISSRLGKEVILINLDGFSPTVDYNEILRRLNRASRCRAFF